MRTQTAPNIASIRHTKNDEKRKKKKQILKLEKLSVSVVTDNELLFFLLFLSLALIATRAQTNTKHIHNRQTHQCRYRQLPTEENNEHAFKYWY